MEVKDLDELIKIFRDKTYKYIEINRKRKNDPNFFLYVLKEGVDTFQGYPIDLVISKRNFKFSIELWSYNPESSNEDSYLFYKIVDYKLSEDFSSAVTAKELLEIMCYDIEDTIINNIGEQK